MAANLTKKKKLTTFSDTTVLFVKYYSAIMLTVTKAISGVIQIVKRYNGIGRISHGWKDLSVNQIQDK